MSDDYPFPLHQHTCKKCGKVYDCQGHPPDTQYDVPAYNCAGKDEGTCMPCLMSKFNEDTRGLLEDGGKLTKEQSNRFIDLVVRRSVLLQETSIKCLSCGAVRPGDVEFSYCPVCGIRRTVSEMAMLAWEGSLPDYDSAHVMDIDERPWITWGDLDEYMASGDDRVARWNPPVINVGGKLTEESRERIRSFLDKHRGQVIVLETEPARPVRVLPPDDDDEST